MYQIRVSKFNHPEQTEGQHTNGPPNVFLRVDNGPWFIALGFRSINRVEKTIKAVGIGYFISTHCSPLGDLT